MYKNFKLMNEIADDMRVLLFGSILPFWKKYSEDTDCGGFYGNISNENQIDRDATKGLVMTARFLWSYSALYNFFGDKVFADQADRALDFLLEHFYDSQYGGFFWSVSRSGKLIDDHKQIYGQAFCIYALSEYIATRDRADLKELLEVNLNLLESHARDTELGGYFEACTRDWQVIESTTLSGKDISCSKSMNTHLHMLEAYTRMLSIGRQKFSAPIIKRIESAISNTITWHFSHIMDPTTNHLNLYFKRDWSRMDCIHSYGHDIEASWLIWEAVEVMDNRELEITYRELVLGLFDAAMEGFRQMEDSDELAWLINEKNGDHIDTDSIWWVQAEAVVGLVNASAITGNKDYLTQTQKIIQYIKSYQVSKNGEWYWAVNEQGRPSSAYPKAGEWKTPYHNVRACLEILKRSETLIGEK